MAIEYSVEPFGPDIVAAYTRLFSDAPEGKSLALLRWRFEKCPHGPGVFAVARSGGRTFGMIALVSTRLRTGTTLQPAYQAIDTVVDPAYRGRGVFVGLGEAAQDSANHHGRILWGFPNANAAPGWFGRLGWRNFGTVPFMVRPLRSGYALRKLLPPLGRIDVPLIGKRTASESHRLIERFGKEADALWSASALSDGVAVDRDAAWLNWRLLEKPEASYRTVGSYGPKGVLGAFVSSCLLDKHNGKICYVMEAMGRSEEQSTLAELIRDELAVAALRGAEVALAWCPHGAANRPAYRRAGFLPFPNRLRPVEIHFGAHALVPSASAVENGSRWFISYLDSDTV